MNERKFTVTSLRRHLVQRAEDALRALGVEQPRVELGPPPDPTMGDLGFPCFAYARSLRRSPALIATQVAEQLTPDEVIESVQVEKAYVNLHLRLATLFSVTLGQILEQGAAYGGGGAAEPAEVMVEYSAPNTNKPLHLGHLRNNLLGAAVARILRLHGHKVRRVNLINDRGVHICKSMLAYQRWGDGVTPRESGEKGDHLVGRFYVEFERRLAEEYAAWQGSEAAEAELSTWLQGGAGTAAVAAKEKDPAAAEPRQVFFSGYKDTYFNTHSALGAEVRAMLRAWEEGDDEVRELWRRMNRWVLRGHDATYKRMGVGFDHVQYESVTYTLGKEVVAEGLDKGVFVRLPDGAVACPAEQSGLPSDKILLRSDGTSVYTTQDLGTAVERFDRFQLDKLIYVVGDEQRYHFEALFTLLGLVRPGLSDACHHLAYGMIRLPEGKMKSREGTVVDADELMDEVHRLARVETEARAAEGKAHTEGLGEEELEHRAEHIGMAAIKYFLLKYTPRKSFEYDPKESIDFLGQTGPYCLFNYARTRSLLRRAGGLPSLSEQALARLGSDREQELLRRLMAFPETVARAAETLDPSRIAEYLFELCKSFAFIFTDKVNHPIVTCEDEALRAGRLLLVAALGTVLRTGLGLLGIKVLEEM